MEVTRENRLDIIFAESLEREKEALAQGAFEGSDQVPDLKHFNGFPATCPVCRYSIVVRHTISAHQWGCMVQGYCGHIFPTRLE